MKPGYWITTWHDDKLIRQQSIEDPFHTTNVFVQLSRLDLLRAMFKRQFQIKIRVALNASGPVIAAVMNLDVPHPGEGKETSDASR